MLQDFKNEIKVFLIVGIVAIVLAVGAILFLQSVQPYPSPLPQTQESPVDTLDTLSDLTAGWQTYRNEEFGFEVGYPPEFTVHKSNDQELDFARRVEGKPQLSIGVRVVVGRESFLGYLAEIDQLRSFAYEGDPSVSVLRRYDTEIAGYPAIQQEIQRLADASSKVETFIDITPQMILVVSIGSDDWEGPPEPPEPSEEMRELNDQILSTFRFVGKKPVIPTDKQSCESKGGIWGRFGLAQVELCNIPTSDAGKSCTDSSQCESACVADENILPDAKTTGKCYGWTKTLGTCLKHVNNGRVEGTLCAD